MTYSTLFEPLFLAYVGIFTLAALGCFAGLLRVDRITDSEVRWGLTTLLLTCGGWAVAHVGYLAGPTEGIQHLFYLVGLVVGIAAVGPWLYFCSAYTGRSLHRNGTIRVVAVGVFLGIVAIKLSNPLHGWYYTTAVVSEPFPHLLVNHEPLHWVVMGFAYALAFLGFFMLFELFVTVDSDVTPLVILVSITGLPILTDIGGVAHEYVLEITYSPLGVAVFAVGVMFVYLDLFQRIKLAGSRSQPVIVLDDDGRIRDSNRAAHELFPVLRGGAGQSLATVLPAVARQSESSDPVLELTRNGQMRYFHVTQNTFSQSQSNLGSMVLLSDVTEREEYRQELERQNERLEQFASMVSHDLRNPLNVATLRVDAARSEHGHSEHLDAADSALQRMEELIDTLLALARHGQPIEETEQVSLSATAKRAWGMIESDGCELVVERDLSFQADANRLQQLFENLFRNSLNHGESVETVRVGSLDKSQGFYVEDDGVGIPEDEREQVFESGYTTTPGGTGFGLAIAAEIVDAHRWTIEVTESSDGGARFEITGVQ